MAAYFIQVNLCWAALFLVYALFLRRETFFTFNRAYLLVSLCIGLIWPTLNWSGWLHPKPDAPINSYLLPLVQVGAAEITINPAIEASADKSGNYLWYLYLLGLVILGFRLLWGIIRLLGMKNTGRTFRWRDTAVVETQQTHSPFSFFNWIFISKRADYLPDELEHVLVHERAHVKGGHSADILFTELIAIFFWCSPLPFLYRQALRLQHEYLADALVLRHSSRRKYGQLLLQQTLLGGHPFVAHPFISSFLKKRIAMMTKTPSRRRAAWKFALALPLMFVLAFTFSLREASAQNQATPPANGGEEALKVVEEMPRFPGCEDLASSSERKACADKKMLEYIFKNLKYPAKAHDEGIEGTVVVGFVVEKDGSLSNIEVLRGVGGGASEEVVRLIQSMNDNNIRWIPGKEKGKAVRVRFNLPIRFKLDNETNAVTPPAPKDSQPLFAGCTTADPAECSNSKLFAFIGANLKYPNSARSSNIQGMVVASFVIDENGQVVEPSIVKPLSPECDNEVLRLLREMPRWTPAYKEGKAQRTELKLPIRFTIPADEPAAGQTLKVNGFEASPNPSNGVIRLKFEAPAAATLIRVLDATGQEVYSRLLNDFDGFFDQTLELSKTAKGTLLLQISQDNAVFVEKLVVQ